MSQADVEIVRRYFQVLDSVLERYAASENVPISDSPLIEEAFALLDEEAEWDAFLRAEPFRGRGQILVAVEDWLEAGEDWRVAIEDLAAAGEHRVLAFLRVSIRGKGSGVPIEQRLYTLVTVRGTKVSRIADFTDRALALEAAGLTE